MTFEQCHSVLAAIRAKQGTRTPMLRVVYAGTVVQGRLSRTDTDLRRESNSPYGIMVLESPGLHRGPEMILQIDNIPEDGLKELWCA